MHYAPLEKDICIELNPARVKSVPVWTVQQGEHRARTCYIRMEKDKVEYEIPCNHIAILNYQKPDRKEVIRHCLIENNTVIVPFCEQMTAVDGLAVAQIIFMTAGCDDIKLVTPPMYFTIIRGMKKSRITSCSQYDVLNKALDKIRETFVVLPDVKMTLDRLDEIHKKTNAALRKATDAQAKADHSLCETRKATAESKAATKDSRTATKECRKATRKANKTADQMIGWMGEAEGKYITGRIVEPKGE